jgi:TetR/AcrR family tetracycline transcriptional repressor
MAGKSIKDVKARSSRAASTARKPSGGEALGRQEVVEGALRIIKTEGVNGLTMRKLAVDLGVTPMAAYHHIPSRTKTGLLELVVDSVLSRVEIPDSSVGTWDRRIGMLGDTVERTLEAYPGLGTVALGTSTPHSRRLLDATIEMLKEGGFDERTAMQAWLIFHAFWYGWMVVTDMSLMMDEAPIMSPLSEIRKRLGRAEPSSMQSTFAFGRDLIISGLKETLAANTP